ncbi:hypothetical protein ACE022_03760 [Shewanella seohaensis]
MLKVPRRHIALVEVDVDPESNRLVICERQSLTTLTNMIVGVTNPIKIVLPEKYALTEKLLIGIMDDDGIYDCKFTDGVLGELVDPRTLI